MIYGTGAAGGVYTRLSALSATLGKDIDGLSGLACDMQSPSCLQTHQMAVQDKSKSAEVALPPIAALFLVVFDRKVGCVTQCTWDKQAADDGLGIR